MADVLMMSQTGRNGIHEMIDSGELAARWQGPESWIRNVPAPALQKKNASLVSALAMH